MGKMIRVTCSAAILAGWVAWAVPASGAERSADEVVKALEQLKMPVVDKAKVSDPNYVRQLQEEFQAFTDKRSSLILELYKTDPNHDKLPPLMGERWARMPMQGPVGRQREQEIQAVLEHAKNPKLKLEALLAKAVTGIFQAQLGRPMDLTTLEEFLKLAPKDERGPQLLHITARFSRDEKAKTAIEERIVKEFPDSRVAASILAVRRRSAAIGKPFELEFTDAITGSTVTMKKLAGKVVVLDFWATWCGPCVAEMPRMKEIYAKYHDRGVEFLGISLDQPKEDGGLDSLKKFVKENEIPWPQYYQGNGWESAFSKSWGIDSIPAMFVVAPDGTLSSVEARENLESIISDLLKKKSAGGATPAGGAP